jgi:hypothetical protein
MATADRLTRMRNIRDQLEKELENETLARLTLTEAGKPPPVTYSSGGKSVSWNDYVSMMVGKIKDLDELILNMGADEGGIPESCINLWV